MTIEDAVRASLAETVEEVTSPEPDIVSLMARGDRTRRRRVAAWLAGVLVAGAVGVGVSTRAGDDRAQRAPAPTSRVTTEPPPPVVVPQPVGSFTVLSTGVVHVEANEPFSIVWEGWQHEHQVLGRRPWHLGGGRNDGVTPGLPYGRHRDIVGNPGLDLVAWVQGVGGERGEVVVVRASTGVVLAHAPLGAPGARHVVLASLDDTWLRLATVNDPLSGVVAARDVWSWRWATGQPPRSSDRHGELVVDVAGGVWAVEATTGLRFEDEAGRELSTVSYDDAVTDRLFFGYGLSPDGRYFYAPGSATVVETATGHVVHTAGKAPVGLNLTHPDVLPGRPGRDDVRRRHR